MAISQPARVFFGFDEDQPLGSYLFAYSLTRQSSMPVQLSPLDKNTLRKIYQYPVKREGATTDFAFTRFLVPFLCEYMGWAIFCDGVDMICTEDIIKLWALRDPSKAVQVVKQNHSPSNATKFLGRQQKHFPKKNWSSVMLFNNTMCRMLTPDYVGRATGEALHQFKWLGGDPDDLIGDLPRKWNQLVDVEPGDDVPGILHWTNGSPYFDTHRHVFGGEIWRRELSNLMGAEYIARRP